MTLWTTTHAHNQTDADQQRLSDAAHSPFSRHPEKGQVLVILVLLLGALVALVGLAVDGAVLYAVQAKLQPAADAAALAAVNVLPQRANVREAAELYVRLNDLPPDTKVQISVGPLGVQEPTLVTVTLSQIVPLSFLAILDVQTAQVTASATASRASAAADLVLALDSSRCNRKGHGWRCSEIRQGAWSLAQAVLDQGGRIGVVDYRRTARVLLPPTSDRKQVQQALQGWGIGANPTDERNLGDALWLAAWKLANLPAERPAGVLVLASGEINVGRNCCVECKCGSDGLSVCNKRCSAERCCGRWGREAASYAQREGVFVVALDGTGTKDGTRLMQDIANGPPRALKTDKNDDLDRDPRGKDCPKSNNDRGAPRHKGKDDGDDFCDANDYYILVGDRVGRKPKRGDYLAAFSEAARQLPGGEGARLVR